MANIRSFKNLKYDKNIICCKNSCFKKAEFRAPKSRESLTDYFWFCLEHIREYNKAWNYYDGMSEREIENEIRSSTTWERPTWPINKNKIEDIENLIVNFETFFNNKGFLDANKNHGFNQKELDAFKKLEINPTIDIDLIKTAYKKLVKKYHPDNKGGGKSYEEILRSIIEAYSLLKKLLNKSF